MADLSTFEENATCYVLGELDAAERRAFEMQLKHSAELRAHVRELEEGLEAAAMTCRPQQPPAELWRRIECALEEESPKVVAPDFQRTSRGYAWAAAACVVGAVALGVWLMRAPAGKSSGEAQLAKSVGTGAKEGNAFSNTTHGTLVLRQTVWESARNSTNRAAAPIPDFETASRGIQFFSAGTTSNASAAPLPPSADLQRALFAAMARELGWPSAHGSEEKVDFVDLRPAEPALAGTSARVVAATGSLIGFVSGDSLLLAFGSNVVPRAQELQFWAGEPDHEEELLIGTASLGQNPIVILIPLGVAPSGGWTLTVTGVTSAGASNVFGQVFIVAPPP